MQIAQRQCDPEGWSGWSQRAKLSLARLLTYGDWLAGWVKSMRAYMDEVFFCLEGIDILSSGMSSTFSHAIVFFSIVCFCKVRLLQTGHAAGSS